MNSIRIQLLKLYPKAEETFGYITKEYRRFYGLDKSHCIDAAIIASKGGNITKFLEKVLIKRCISKGDYQQTKGERSEKKIPTGKIQGFRKFDKVLYQGKEYFIKGKMSSGYAILMNIDGKKVKLKPMPKFDNMVRLSARKSQMVALQKANSSSP